MSYILSPLCALSLSLSLSRCVYVSLALLGHCRRRRRRCGLGRSLSLCRSFVPPPRAATTKPHVGWMSFPYLFLVCTMEGTSALVSVQHESTWRFIVCVKVRFEHRTDVCLASGVMMTIDISILLRKLASSFLPPIMNENRSTHRTPNEKS